MSSKNCKGLRIFFSSPKTIVWNGDLGSLKSGRVFTSYWNDNNAFLSNIGDLNWGPWSLCVAEIDQVLWLAFFCFFKFLSKIDFRDFFILALCCSEGSRPNGTWFRPWHACSLYFKLTNQVLSTPFSYLNRDNQIRKRVLKMAFFVIFWTFVFQHRRNLRGSNPGGKKGDAQASCLCSLRGWMVLVSPKE